MFYQTTIYPCITKLIHKINHDNDTIHTIFICNKRMYTYICTHSFRHILCVHAMLSTFLLSFMCHFCLTYLLPFLSTPSLCLFPSAPSLPFCFPPHSSSDLSCNWWFPEHSLKCRFKHAECLLLRSSSLEFTITSNNFYETKFMVSSNLFLFSFSSLKEYSWLMSFLMFPASFY